jgi:GST-like protein
MEVKRQLDVLNRNLSERRYLCGDEYNIADIATYSWYGQLCLGRFYDDPREFLDTASYTEVLRWTHEIESRPAVLRGLRVNKTFGPEEEQVRERHAASDIDKTFAAAG